MGTRRDSLEAIGRVIERGTRFVATTHVRPDGDAVGSLAALALGLDCLGWDVLAVLSDPVPEAYAFLPGVDRIAAATSPREATGPFDAGIALDCDGADRMGDAQPLVEAATLVVDIDHHEGLKAFGDLRCVDSDAPCTGDLVMELLADVLSVPLSPEIATCLLTCHIYDTGRFGQSNADSRAFANASRLVAAGASPEDVVRRVFETRSLARTRLRGRALARAECQDGVVWTVIEEEDFAATASDAADTEGIVEELRAVGNGRIAIVVSADPRGGSRVSLRSRDGTANVAKLAARFGGGGHFRAAGCTVDADPRATAEMVLEAARELLATAAPQGADGPGT